MEWAELNHLRLNVSKTREMVIDFRKKRTPSQPLRIGGEEVEVVEDYKYLGVTINNRLDWKSNTEAVYKKGMSRLYFLRKLRSFNVCSKMLEIFYQSVVPVFFSLLLFAGVAALEPAVPTDLIRILRRLDQSLVSGLRLLRPWWRKGY